MSARRTGLFYGIIALTAILDLATKEAARGLLTEGRPAAWLPFLDLRLQYNSGAAFGLLSSAGAWGRWFLVLTSIAVIAFLLRWLHREPMAGALFPAGIALVVGGAAGNLYERLFAGGGVTDFISVHWSGWYFPTFNIADAAITVGACLLLLCIRGGRTL